jgi:effector-binding domain-containing protein
MPDYSVVIKKIPVQTVASRRDVIPTYADIGKLFNELFGYIGKQRARFTGPPLAIYYDPEYRERDIDVEVAVPIAGTLPANGGIKMVELPAVEQMACLIHKGTYETFNLSYQTIMSWFGKNGYQPAGPNREVYLVGPGQNTDPTAYVAELQLPIAKK